MRQLISLTLFMIFAAVTGTAQDNARFSIRTSADTVLMGNYLVVSFTLENASAQDFQAPLFEQFDIVSGPNMSSSFSMINGKVTQQASYTFHLRPRDAGNFYIEPASIRIDEDAVLETEPVEIIVLPNPEGIIQEPEPLNNLRFQFEDLMTPGKAEPGEKKPSKKKKKTYKI